MRCIPILKFQSKEKLNPEEHYKLWKKDLFANKSMCEFLMSCSFENEFYYAEASIFFDKKPDEPIGIKKYRKSKISFCSTKEKTEDQCSICLTNLQSMFSKKYIKLECGHSFHEKCFKNYVESKKKQSQVVTCPLCRFGVSEDDKEITRLKEARLRRN
tara:strand:- start:533 stop:1006 length:474 start_codon:yes stop_codon:yes gene_type:complete